MAVPGPVLFARYAYPPSELGYCGPGDPAGMLRSASLAEGVLGPASPPGGIGDLERRAARFDGAWPYLKLIARSSGIPDPLAADVVEAYWVGNGLLANVSPGALAGCAPKGAGIHLESPGRHLFRLERVADGGAVAQHSFHVFAVYPWLGILRSGAREPALGILDRCRIRWGRVQDLDGDFISVISRPLLYEEKRLRLGAPRPERVRHELDGMSPVPHLQPGDAVSLHWDWVCDRLSLGALRYLVWSTRRNLAAVNVLGAGIPG